MQLNQRVEANKTEKKRLLRNIGDGVSAEAQRIYDYLNKTLVTFIYYLHKPFC